MDFLKSAVASIAKGPAFPYTFGERVDLDQSIWTLHNGVRREDGSKCSIFSFEIAANRARLPLAKNALRKFRTLRHPGIVRVLDAVETDSHLYVATELLIPLPWATKRRSLPPATLTWGLHAVAKTLKFINDEAASIHGNVRASSIFTSESGEWKVAGLEILSSVKEDDAVIYTQGSLVPDIGRYSAPEVTKTGWDAVRKGPTHAVDAHGFGILISEVFTGSFAGTDQLAKAASVPKEMQASYRRLIHAVPKMRLSIAHFLDQGSRSGGFFDTPLVQLSDNIESLGLKSETERDAFLTELETVTASAEFPEPYLKSRILPALLHSLEFGGGAGPKTFALILRIASKLSEDEYTASITPVVVRLFTLPDRALRVCLLDNLPHMIDHLSNKVVTDKIFPQMATGFGDLAPVVREQTVKAVLVVVPKLSDRIINGELLRHLAKTANDDQPGIRTNTTICLGKIARNLSPNSRSKVLSAAFSRALRDPFIHARNAALMALGATADCFSEDDCATKMLPAICPSLVDKEKIIREQANKTLNMYLDRVRKYGLSLPDSVLPPESSSAGATRVSTPQPHPAGLAGGAGGLLMGWAISSFTNKVSQAQGEIQTNGSGARPTPGEAKAATVTAPAQGTIPHAALARSQPAKVSESDPVDDDIDDFNDGWGDNNDADDAVDAEDDGGWGAEEADAWSTPLQAKPASTARQATSSRPSTATYDDGGEPDFEGWLNAQAAAKKGQSAAGTKALPKGLVKKTVLPTVVARTASAPVVPKRTVPAVVVNKPVVVKKAEEEDDGWDAWG